jgi:glycosyltransferase involved in cell wall biosynthesis
MKVVYFSPDLNDKSSGVEKKITSQVFFLKQLGIETTVVAITDIDPAQIECQDIWLIPRPSFSKSRIRLVNILNRENFIIRRLWDVICQLNTDDILYMRFHYPFFRWWYFIQKKRKCKIVFEHQSLETHEYIMKGKYFYPIFDYIFGGSIRRHCDGIVGVTEEITDYQVKRSGDGKKPHITIGNGINVDTVPIKTSFPFSDFQLHLLCVTNVTKWHGLDRIIQGISNYKGRTKIHLHIVGGGEEIPALEKIVKDLSITDAVSFYGPLYGKDLDDMFNRCDIAVGTLGIHRKCLHEASTLKAREYCARGIPFIEGTCDLDFPPAFPYSLHIPADESPVDMTDVIRFAKTVYSDLSFPIKMRDYAKKSLDWSVKTPKLKQFLESLA